MPETIRQEDPSTFPEEKRFIDFLKDIIPFFVLVFFFSGVVYYTSHIMCDLSKKISSSPLTITQNNNGTSGGK